MADRLVLSKTDLLAGGGFTELRGRLTKLNPGAILLDAAKGEATAGALLDAGIYDPDRKIPDVRRWLNAEAFAARGADDHPPSTCIKELKCLGYLWYKPLLSYNKSYFPTRFQHSGLLPPTKLIANSSSPRVVAIGHEPRQSPGELMLPSSPDTASRESVPSVNSHRRGSHSCQSCEIRAS